MSMPFADSVNGARTLPFTGQTQSTSSLSVPGDLSGSEGADVGGGVGTGTGATSGVVGGATGGAMATVGPPGSGDESCASARSENGTFWPRGSTFAFGVFASGRAS